MVGRNNTSAFDTEISGDVIEPRVLIDAGFTGSTLYVWDGIGSIDYNGNTYTGLGDYLSISDVQESTELRTENISISLSGITTAYKSLALQSIEISNPVTVRFALLNSPTSVIADADIIFKGFMDEVKVTESATGATFELDVINELSQAQKVKERRYTDQDHQARHSGDTIMRHAINSKRESKWGSG